MSVYVCVSFAVFVCGGLFGNLHLVLADHHQPHDHAHEDGHDSCLSATWSCEDGCHAHFVPTAWESASRGVKRAVQVSSLSALPPPAVALATHDVVGPALTGSTPPTPQGAMMCAAPARAPPCRYRNV